MNPTFSVVMPTRGRPVLVRRAVESVLDQTVAELELLILDNSLTGDMEEIRRMSYDDSRVTFVNRGDIGVTDARRLGAKLAVGRLLALIDSDDVWDRHRLEKHLDVWHHNRIGLSWDRWAELSAGRTRTFPQPFEPGLIRPPIVAKRLYGWNFIHASAGIVSAGFARENGFPILDIMSSDWPLFMRAAENQSAYFIGETLSFTDATSHNRVTNTVSQERFRKDERKIRRWFFVSRPDVYALPYLRTQVNMVRRQLQPSN